MICKILSVGPIQCNCILLGCEKTREAVVIDPGDEVPRIMAELEKDSLDPKLILHTHAHYDHVGGTGELRRRTGAPICLHRDDEKLYENFPMQASFLGGQAKPLPPIEKFLEDNEVIAFGNLHLKTIHTPGHSPGGISFKLLEEPGFLLVGDTLFQGSIGRTDLWGGNFEQLIESIKTRLFAFEDQTIVHPGHGPSTSIGRERASNPFLSDSGSW